MKKPVDDADLVRCARSRGDGLSELQVLAVGAVVVDLEAVGEVSTAAAIAAGHDIPIGTGYAAGRENVAAEAV